MTHIKENSRHSDDIVSRLEERVKQLESENEDLRREAGLFPARKMEAIGRLAGGVAHDFNNILTAIIGYANIILMKSSREDPNRPYLEQILSSSERAAHLTHSLLAFSRKQIINPRPTDINGIITKVEKFLRRIIGEDIEIRTSLTDKDSTAMVDPAQIEQVLMNLATNARDAMPDGGHITIETAVAELDQEYINTFGYGTLGTYVLVTFSDTGSGMDEKTRSRVFEPFFTTKEVGKGTGLGLSLVYGIVKQHNGFINCYSEPGRGTTFRIYLPVARRESREEKAGKGMGPGGGTETILLAEDDSSVRQLIKIVLESFGYSVLEAEDGAGAVELFRGRKAEIAMVIMDIVLPKMNGRDAYREMSGIKQGLKALFMSGYTANVMHKQGVLDEGLDFISKPVSPKDLLLKVREILDR